MRYIYSLTRRSTSKHGGDSSAGSVVGVHVDGNMRKLLSQRRDEQRGGCRLEQTSHVLDGQHVSTQTHQLSEMRFYQRNVSVLILVSE